MSIASESTPLLIEDVANSDNQRVSSTSKYILGPFLAILSGVLFTANNFIITLTKSDFGEILATRSVLQCLVMLAVTQIRGYRVIPNPWREKLLLLLVGLFGAVIMLSTFIGVQCIPVGDAMALIFSSPLFTIVLAAIFLKQRITIVKSFAGIGLFAGVILVAKPPFLFPPPANNSTSNRSLNTFDLYPLDPPEPDRYFMGACLCLLAAISGAFVNICVAKLDNTPPSVNLLYVGVGGFIISFLTEFSDPNNRIFSANIVEISWQDWLIYLGLAISGITGFFVMVQSLQLIPPGPVSALRSLEIVFAFTVQIVALSQVPSAFEVAGSLLVVLCALVITFEEPIAKSCQVGGRIQ